MIARMKMVKKQEQKDTPKTLELRERLKALMDKELDRLPETLEAMEPRDRINAVLRLMPFIFPKLDSIRHDRGERDEWGLS